MVSTESSTAAKKPRSRKASTGNTDPGLALAQRMAQIMLEKKADGVTVLDVGALTSFADYFVLATAQSDRQVHALGRALAETLKHEGHPPLSTEGEQQSHWVLMDFGGVVAHIFYEPARAYYDLDGLWGDAPRVAIEDDGSAQKAADRRKASAQDGGEEDDADDADDGVDADQAAMAAMPVSKPAKRKASPKAPPPPKAAAPKRKTAAAPKAKAPPARKPRAKKKTDD